MSVESQVHELRKLGPFRDGELLVAEVEADVSSAARAWALDYLRGVVREAGGADVPVVMVPTCTELRHWSWRAVAAGLTDAQLELAAAEMEVERAHRAEQRERARSALEGEDGSQ